MLNLGFTDSSEQSSSQGTALPPEYAQKMQEANMGLLNMVANQFIQAPGDRVAGVNADQLQAWDLAGNYAQNQFTAPKITAPAYGGLTGTAAQVDVSKIPTIQGYTPTATGTGKAAQSQFQAAKAAQLGANDYAKFLNPYTKEVVNTTQAQMARANAEQDAARNAAYAKAGAFGGSRQAVAQGVSDARYAQDVGAMTAQLMARGYDTATATALANTQMQQQTALQNSQLGTMNNQFNAGQSNQLAGLNAQLGTQASIAGANNQTQASSQQAQMLANVLSGNAAQSNAFALQNAGLGLQSSQLNNQFANDEAARQASAIQMLLGTGNQQQAQLQKTLDVPWDTLSMMINATNQTATAGKETQQTSQSTKESSKFDIGLPFFGK